MEKDEIGSKPIPIKVNKMLNSRYTAEHNALSANEF